MFSLLRTYPGSVVDLPHVLPILCTYPPGSVVDLSHVLCVRWRLPLAGEPDHSQLGASVNSGSRKDIKYIYTADTMLLDICDKFD
jgi:hypothetical protein